MIQARQKGKECNFPSGFGLFEKRRAPGCLNKIKDLISAIEIPGRNFYNVA